MIGIEGRRAKGCEERESIGAEKRCEEKKIMGERKGRNGKECTRGEGMDGRSGKGQSRGKGRRGR